MVSAAWHGTEAGYIMFFIGMAFMELNERNWDRSKIAKKVRAVLPWPIVSLLLMVFNYYWFSILGIGFVVKKMNRIAIIWS